MGAGLAGRLGLGRQSIYPRSDPYISGLDGTVPAGKGVQRGVGRSWTGGL